MIDEEAIEQARAKYWSIRQKAIAEYEKTIQEAEDASTMVKRNGHYISDLVNTTTGVYYTEIRQQAEAKRDKKIAEAWKVYTDISGRLY